MARIRTIKPEFWTDPKIVALPYEVRLLFIGLWNFSDDHGFLSYDPERIKMQVFPGDGLEVSCLLDILAQEELIEIIEIEGGREAIRITNFSAHQKIDHPSKSKIVDGARQYKKRAILSSERQALARAYGCAPGQRMDVNCAYCGEAGEICWWTRSNGKPSFWVTFTLEIDHIEPESRGGPGNEKNLILACRRCNRRKGNKDARPILFAKPREDSRVITQEGKGREGKGEERKGKDIAPLAASPEIIKELTPLQRVVGAYKVAKGNDRDDRAWDKANFGRYSKAAKSLLDAFDGDDKKAVVYLLGKGQEWDEAGLSDWGLDAITKHAWDNKGKLSEAANGLEHGAMDAGSVLGSRGHRRIAQAGELSGETMRRLESAGKEAAGLAGQGLHRGNADEVRPSSVLAGQDGSGDEDIEDEEF